MALSLISPPLAGPISLSEAKAWLRVEHDEDDAIITSLLAACLAHLEAVAGMHLITQTWRQYADELPPSGMIRLETGPVRNIAGVRWYGEDGNPVGMGPDDILLDQVSNPARLCFLVPVRPAQPVNGIEIDIVAGFGDTGNEVPDNLKRALFLLLAHAYEFRGAIPADHQPASEPHGFRTLVAPYRRVSL